MNAKISVCVCVCRSMLVLRLLSGVTTPYHFIVVLVPPSQLPIGGARYEIPLGTKALFFNLTDVFPNGTTITSGEFGSAPIIRTSVINQKFRTLSLTLSSNVSRSLVHFSLKGKHQDNTDNTGGEISVRGSCMYVRVALLFKLLKMKYSYLRTADSTRCQFCSELTSSLAVWHGTRGRQFGIFNPRCMCNRGYGIWFVCVTNQHAENDI